MKAVFKHLISLAVVLVASILFIATGPTTTEALLVPSFSYATPASQEANSAGLTIALIRPEYSGGKMEVEPFASFIKSLEEETIEVLTSRGYSIRGPFNSRDEMVYSDKEACDLALTVDVAPDILKTTGYWLLIKQMNGNSVYRLSKAELSIFGKINMTAFEPISGEKMWSKSVEIPQRKTTPITASILYNGTSNLDNARIAALIVAGDPNVINPITIAYQESFSDIMTKINSFLDPAEFQRMKPKIKELKAKG